MYSYSISILQRAFCISNVIQPRRPTRAILRVGISDYCLSRRILWTARTVHEAFEAISLVSNPSVSRVLIRIRYTTSSYGTMIAAGTKAPTLAGMENGGKGWERGHMGPRHIFDEAG